MKDWRTLLVGLFSGILASGVIYLVASQPRGTPIELLPVPTAQPMLVYVTGEVNNPGVYSMDPQSRMKDAVDAAGGFSSSADINQINLAGKLIDGQKVIIPALVTQTSTKENSNPEITAGLTSTAVPTKKGLVNINTASLDELDSLPGIGPAKAQQIIDYRTQHGPFQKIEDLQLVSGIGPAIFDGLKNLISISD